MRKILQNLIEDFKFEKIEGQLSESDENIEVYVNSYNEEMYIFDYSNNLDLKHILQILDEQAYRNQNVNRANRANMVYISVFEYVSFNENTRNAIMRVEENIMFCQKLVFYYTEEEKNLLMNLLKDNRPKQFLNDMIMSSNFFRDYKIFTKEKSLSDKEISSNAKTYSIISKIFIKLPFMTLIKVEKFNKSIASYISENLNEINENLYPELNLSNEVEDNSEFIDNVLSLVDLDSLYEKEINKELEKVGAYIEE